MIVKLSQGQGNFFHDDLEQKKNYIFYPEGFVVQIRSCLLI